MSRRSRSSSRTEVRILARRGQGVSLVWLVLAALRMASAVYNSTSSEGEACVYCG